MPQDRILEQAGTIVSWLHRQALEGAAAGTILEGLCARLLAGGVDLDRAVVAFIVFHPLFDAINFAWSRDLGRAERHTVTWQLFPLSSPTPFGHMHSTGIEELRYRLEDGEAELPFPILEQLQSRGLTDYFAFFQPFGGSVDPQFWPDVPSGTAIREGITGSFATARAGGFHGNELAALRVLAPPLALAVKTAAAHEMAEVLLGTYLGAASGRSVLRGRVRRGQGEVIHAVVWHSDLRGSTALAESVPLEVYLATLNAYFDCVVEAVAARGGEVLKLIGDGLLAIFPFGAGTRAGEEACRQALAAGREALGRLAEVNARRAAEGAVEIRCGIAIHAGDIMYGNVGSAQRLDFTVTGAAVNEVFRLEMLCKVLAVPLVISEAVASLYPEQLLSLGQHTLPGIGRAIKVFSLPGSMEG